MRWVRPQLKSASYKFLLNFEDRVIHVTEGKDAATVAAFAEDLTAHGGDPHQIAEVCIDMSPAFIKGVAEHLPSAGVTFGKFHIVRIVNDAVDEVRRTERETHAELKGTRYIWPRNPAHSRNASVPRWMRCPRAP